MINAFLTQSDDDSTGFTSSDIEEHPAREQFL